MEKKTIQQMVTIPEGVELTLDQGLLTFKGPKGELKRDFANPVYTITQNDGKLIIKGKKSTKREKRLVGTITAHVKNMIKGVQEGFIYKLKVCSSHFPMTATVANNELTVKNFLGEKKPRVTTFDASVSVKIEGSEIIVEALDKELAGQAAASIEQLTRISNRDKRIFQDGIFITEKVGKKVI